MTVTAVKVLTSAERAELSELESCIQRGMSSFIEVGNALLRIRERELFRATHATFTEYVEERWGMGGRSARRTISSAQVAQRLAILTDVKVENVSQARVLDEVVKKSSPKVAAEILEETVGQGKGKALDIQAAAEARGIEIIGSNQRARRVKEIASADPKERADHLARQFTHDRKKIGPPMSKEEIRYLVEVINEMAPSGTMVSITRN